MLNNFRGIIIYMLFEGEILPILYIFAFLGTQEREMVPDILELIHVKILYVIYGFPKQYLF